MDGWKYLIVALLAAVTIGATVELADAANPTMEQILQTLQSIQAQLGNLSNVATVSDTGQTKAINYWFDIQLGDGEIYNNWPLLGETEGKNKSGQISLYSWDDSTPPPKLTLFCDIRGNDASLFNNAIEVTMDGSINTTFSCNAMSLGVQDIPDGNNPDENVLINIQYVEAELTE
jgi:hypothetical protein